MQCDAFSMFFSHDWQQLDDPFWYSFPDAWWEMVYDANIAAQFRLFKDLGSSWSVLPWNTQLCILAFVHVQHTKLYAQEQMDLGNTSTQPHTFSTGEFQGMWETMLATIFMMWRFVRLGLLTQCQGQYLLWMQHGVQPRCDTDGKQDFKNLQGDKKMTGWKHWPCPLKNTNALHSNTQSGLKSIYR